MAIKGSSRLVLPPLWSNDLRSVLPINFALGCAQRGITEGYGSPIGERFAKQSSPAGVVLIKEHGRWSWREYGVQYSNKAIRQYITDGRGIEEDSRDVIFLFCFCGRWSWRGKSIVLQ